MVQMVIGSYSLQTIGATGGGGGLDSGLVRSFGIRPLVELNDGVYIVSGDGTAASPYVLGKE